MSSRGGLSGLLDKVARVGSQVGQISRTGSGGSTTKRTTRLSRDESLGQELAGLAPIKSVRSMGFDSGDDLSPLGESPPPSPTPSSKPFQPLNNFECETGSKVTAHSLRNRKDLNGVVGKVRDNNQSDNKVLVDFAPHKAGKMLLRPANLFLGAVPKADLTGAQRGGGDDDDDSPRRERGRSTKSDASRTSRRSRRGSESESPARERSQSRRSSRGSRRSGEGGREKRATTPLTLNLVGEVVIGQDVEVVGLEQHTEYNGLKGVITDDMPDGSRASVMVELPDGIGKKAISTSNLVVHEVNYTVEDFANGMVVEARGLQKDMTLNGKKGVVIDDTGETRIMVDFGAHGKRALKPKNLRPASEKIAHDIEFLSTNILKYFRGCFKVTKMVRVGMIDRKEERYWVVDFFKRRLIRPADCRTQMDAIRVASGNDPTTKYHSINEVFKIEADLKDCTRLDLRIAKTDHPFELSFESATHRQRFMESVKALRLDLIWSPFFTMNSEIKKPLNVKIKGSHNKVPLIGSKDEHQRIAGETRLNCTSFPTTDCTAWVGVLELGERKIINEDAANLKEWLEPAEDAELVLIVVTNFAHTKETEKDPNLKVSKVFANVLSEHGFSQLLSTEVIGGNKASVVVMMYIKRTLVVHCSNPSVWSGTHQQTFKPKGFLAKTKSLTTDLVKVSFHLRETPMCIVGVDLSAVAQGYSAEAIEQRNAVLSTLLSRLDKGESGFTGDAVERYDHVIVAGNVGHGFKGDANLADWDGHASELLRGDDCLSREVQKGRMLHGFGEGDMKLNDIHQQDSLQCRVLWRSRTLLTCTHQDYESQCIEEALKATGCLTTFAVEALYAEAFAHPTAFRKIDLENFKYRPSAPPGRTQPKTHLVCYFPQAVNALTSSTEIRYQQDTDKYTGATFPVINPTLHGYQYLKRRRLLISVMEGTAVLGSASVSIGEAVRAPGKGVKFKRPLKRGGVELENGAYIEGSIKITEDRSPLKELEAAMRAQFNAAMKRLVEEETMQRKQIQKDAKAGEGPLLKIQDKNRRENRERLEKRARAARQEIKNVPVHEEDARVRVLQGEKAARQDLLKAMRVSFFEANKAQQLLLFEQRETKLRNALFLEEQEEFYRLTWKEQEQMVLYKEEADLREALKIEEELARDHLHEHMQATTQHLKRYFAEVEAQKLAEVRQLEVEEHLARTKIVDEEEDASYELECAMHASAEAAARARGERLKREQMAVYQLVTDEAAGRRVIEQAGVADWNKLRSRFFEELRDVQRKERKSFCKIEEERRKTIIEREETFWSNLRAEEMAAWRKSTREATRITPNAHNRFGRPAASRSPSPHRPPPAPPVDSMLEREVGYDYWLEGYGPYGPYTELDHDVDRQPPHHSAPRRYPSYYQDRYTHSHHSGRSYDSHGSDRDPAYYGSPPPDYRSPSPYHGHGPGSPAHSHRSGRSHRGHSEACELRELDEMRDNMSQASTNAYAQMSPLHSYGDRRPDGGLNEHLLEMLKKADQALARVEWSAKEGAVDEAVEAKKEMAVQKAVSRSRASSHASHISRGSTRAGYDDRGRDRAARRDSRSSQGGGASRGGGHAEGRGPSPREDRGRRERREQQEVETDRRRERRSSSSRRHRDPSPHHTPLSRPLSQEGRDDRDPRRYDRPRVPPASREMLSRSPSPPQRHLSLNPTEVDVLKTEIAALRQSVERTALHHQHQQKRLEEQLEAQGTVQQSQLHQQDEYGQQIALIKQQQQQQQRCGSRRHVDDDILPPLQPPAVPIADRASRSPYYPPRSPSPEQYSDANGDAYYAQIDESSRWRRLPLLDEHEIPAPVQPQPLPRAGSFGRGGYEGGRYEYDAPMYDVEPVAPLTPPHAVARAGYRERQASVAERPVSERERLLNAALSRVDRVRQQSRQLSPGHPHLTDSPHRSPLRQRNPSALSSVSSYRECTSHGTTSPLRRDYDHSHSPPERLLDASYYSRAPRVQPMRQCRSVSPGLDPHSPHHGRGGWYTHYD
eukprot:TRINITY_DN4429_c0_g1_i1.p1 TRINITY_DN4429_c0_g1~~TRINITY_DN4429_c0_g1_i1.p1  ORF type:complete len:1999 (+),score=665.31 TRINITY_DN4429_c0_g1_i1:121-6117(+)